MLNKLTTCTLLLILLLLLLTTKANAGKAAKELDWEALIPEGFNPVAIIEDYQKKYNIDELPDDDPKVKDLMDKLNAMLKNSPVKKSMNGKLIKLPGYVVPLETDGKKSSEFLLVPYYGACIHVPPPPSNQTVYVTTKDKKGATVRKLFDVVWVTGIIKTEKLSTELADAGYKIEATKVEPYE